MSSNPSQWAAQRAFGTKVPSAMANLGRREDTVVLLARRDSPVKLAGQTSGRKLRNSTLGGPSRVVTYETQDNRSSCPDGPDVGQFPAGGRSAALYRCFHRWSFFGIESVFSAWLSGPGEPGRPPQSDFSGNVPEHHKHRVDVGRVIAWDR